MLSQWGVLEAKCTRHPGVSHKVVKMMTFSGSPLQYGSSYLDGQNDQEFDNPMYSPGLHLNAPIDSLSFG